ncbi:MULTISPECIES: hypothetical protein [Sphingomonas]|uniref:hypothetical protein n=1 Tax=Sphingomonas TaxID=13687 RepID=UPI00254CFBBD|nr:MULTISPECIES: hypothetical protein [Sphingomonas]MDK8188432.1 hypothetical protein [Sphingomonas zeae]MDK8216349.1 hypothetical protein [Sphingomonas sp. UMB7805-LC452B]
MTNTDAKIMREAGMTEDAMDQYEQAEKVQWIVNDIAELGVLVDGVAYFLYKGHSLIYADPVHEETGKPMRYRLVGKREFGECAHPINYAEPSLIGTVDPENDGEEWLDLPAFPGATS